MNLFINIYIVLIYSAASYLPSVIFYPTTNLANLSIYLSTLCTYLSIYLYNPSVLSLHRMLTFLFQTSAYKWGGRGGELKYIYCPLTSQLNIITTSHHHQHHHYQNMIMFKRTQGLSIRTSCWVVYYFTISSHWVIDRVTNRFTYKLCKSIDTCLCKHYWYKLSWIHYIYL